MPRRTGTRWNFDCAIIGGGPGGLVSALYLRRFERSTVLINAGIPRAAWIPRTHNLLAYPQGISGPRLLARLRHQVSRYGLPLLKAEAVVKRWHSGFKVELSSGGSLLARKVILATGIEDRQPGLPNLLELRRAGLLRYCSVCDGYEYRGQPLAVLAEDDAGIQKGLFLRTWTSDITLLLPEHLRLSPQRTRELRASAIRVLRGSRLGIEIARSPRGLWIRMEPSAAIYARVAYVELGARVRDSAFANLRGLRRSREGFPLTTAEQRTSIPGLFAVGDCVNLLGQLSVAAGQAAVAATTVHNDLLA